MICVNQKGAVAGKQCGKTLLSQNDSMIYGLWSDKKMENGNYIFEDILTSSHQKLI